MDTNTFILISCFILTNADTYIKNIFPPFMRKLINQEEYLANEAKAIYQLVPTEDVFKYWNSSDSVADFGNSWLVLPDGNSTPTVAIINDESADKPNIPLPFSFPVSDEVQEAEENIKFHLYNNEYPDGLNFSLNSLDTLEFPKTDGVKIICHGWRANGQADVIQNIKNVYLAEQNVSVIGVDWSYGARSVLYNVCAKKTPFVGKAIAKLIDDLAEKYKTPYEDFHIIGHSLGAHIAGFAGRNTKSKIKRITGLDPALPGFQYFEIAGGRLNKNDAEFVDIIHSCASSLGMSVPIGHIDFYPNGGSPLQPGCPEQASDNLPPGLDVVACSHARSFKFFEESIKKDSDFSAVKCQNWSDFKEHVCLKTIVKMGDKAHSNMTGTFYLKTKEDTPFFLGMEGTIY